VWAHAAPPGEVAVLREVALRPEESGHVWWQALSEATESVPLVVVTGVAAVALVVTGRRFDSALLAVSVLAVTGLNPLVKSVVDRPRPSVVELTGDVSAGSFPSGHAAVSAALLAAAAVVVGRRTSAAGGWAVLAVAVGIAVLVGVGQLVLGRHYPSDVLAGWLLAGAVVAALHAVVYGNRLRATPS
jgi:undecaprenyl-diphosphatase